MTDERAPEAPRDERLWGFELDDEPGTEQERIQEEMLSPVLKQLYETEEAGGMPVSAYSPKTLMMMGFDYGWTALTAENARLQAALERLVGNAALTGRADGEA